LCLASRASRSQEALTFNKTPKPPECTKLIRVGFFGLPNKTHCTVDIFFTLAV